MNIVIPMAGRGSRFQKEGIFVPKPLIEIGGRPMIQWAVESFGIDGQYIFIVQQEHIEKYDLDNILNKIIPNSIIIPIDYITEGQANSVLLAEKYIDNNNPVVSTNCDQITDWNKNEFLHLAETNVDGIIPVFEDSGPKWSYAAVDENGYVTRTAEKLEISKWATVGTYFWKRGTDLVKYTNQMISKNLRVNNEFYSCPVYNEAIADGKLISILEIKKLYPVGTPEDLHKFIESSFYKNFYQIKD